METGRTALLCWIILLEEIHFTLDGDKNKKGRQLFADGCSLVCICMKLSERIEQYMANIDDLPKGRRVQLRRAAGQRLGEANVQAMMAFYSCLPPGYEMSKAEKDIWFASGCLHCLWEPDLPNSSSLPVILRKMACLEDAEDKYTARLANLMDTAYGDDGYLLKKIYRLARQTRQTTNLSLDCSSLLRDLLRWNYTDQPVQQRWATAFYGTDETENTSKEESDAD